MKNLKDLPEAYRRQLPGPQADWPPKVRRALVFIIAHLFDRELTVAWMKEQCYISNKSFSARFRACLGYYPGEFITHHRIEAGKQMLVETEESITRIAIVIGYASLEAFDNTFKNNTGMTPGEWREQNRN